MTNGAFDVVVVGRGMIGSAAGRHLSESGSSVALVGPSAPDGRYRGSGPFSSHSDEGRITRVFGRTSIWAMLAASSISRYDDIETRSGIQFYNNSGVVAAFNDAHDWISSAAGHDFQATAITPEWLRLNTGISVPPGVQVAYETSPAGHINPKRLVEAQTRLVELAGGTVIDGAVAAIRRTEGGWAATGPWGEVSGRQLLLATGTYGASLIGSRLDMHPKPRTVLLAKVDEPIAIPALISTAPDDRLSEIYWVPPVQYVDSGLCLKIGGDMVDTPALEPGQFDGWFNSSAEFKARSDQEADALGECLRSLLPDVGFVGYDQMPCVITTTASGYPYIGWIDDQLAVAVGGNGSAAKSSDEVGRLAASLFSERGWNGSIDAAAFEPKFVS